MGYEAVCIELPGEAYRNLILKRFPAWIGRLLEEWLSIIMREKGVKNVMSVFILGGS